MTDAPSLRRAQEVGAAPTICAPRALDQAEAEIGVLARIPAALIAETAELKTVAQPAWADARANNDFSAYAPMLERMFAISARSPRPSAMPSIPMTPCSGSTSPA